MLLSLANRANRSTHSGTLSLSERPTTPIRLGPAP